MKGRRLFSPKHNTSAAISFWEEFFSRFEKRPKTIEDDQNQVQVSTELTISCGIQAGAKKHKARETGPSPAVIKFLTENPHDEEEQVSTALMLCDESLINPQSQRRNPMKDSAINSNALASKTARNIVRAARIQDTNKKVINVDADFHPGDVAAPDSSLSL